MKRAGSITPSANRITLLRAARGAASADQRFVFADRLNSPYGMTLVGHRFYVANSDALVRFEYVDGETHVTGSPTKVVDLPAGPINHHWTKNVIANADGSRLYVTVGSNSNAGDNGLAAEAGRAAVWEIDPATGQHRIYASGLRNPNGLAWVPGTDKLWAVVNERDELGGDLVPDYMTALVDGGFYGFPFSYYGSHVDARVKQQQPDMVAKAIVPEYALGAHTASLGLVYEPGFAGSCVRAVFPRHVCRPTWVLESQAAQRLSRRVCPIPARPAGGRAARCVDRVRQFKRRSLGATGRRGFGQRGCFARCRRCWQCSMARNCRAVGILHGDARCNTKTQTTGSGSRRSASFSEISVPARCTRYRRYRRRWGASSPRASALGSLPHLLDAGHHRLG